MPGRLRANGISGCLFFLTARSAEAENRQIFQDAGKYFLEHHFPQSVPVTRGQGQSPALEGGAHANFRVTSPLPRGGRFRKSGRLEHTLRHSIPRRELSGEGQPAKAAIPAAQRAQPLPPKRKIGRFSKTLENISLKCRPAVRTRDSRPRAKPGLIRLA